MRICETCRRMEDVDKCPKCGGNMIEIPPPESGVPFTPPLYKDKVRGSLGSVKK